MFCAPKCHDWPLLGVTKLITPPTHYLTYDLLTPNTLLLIWLQHGISNSIWCLATKIAHIFCKTSGDLDSNHILRPNWGEVRTKRAQKRTWKYMEYALNLLASSDAYVRRWTGCSLVQLVKVACWWLMTIRQHSLNIMLNFVIGNTQHSEQYRKPYHHENAICQHLHGHQKIKTGWMWVLC